VNDQDWRRVSQGLAVVLAVLVVAVLVIIVLRPGSPGAETSPSSSLFAVVSPSASSSPSIGPSPSRSARPSRSPKPSGSPGESPSASPGESLLPGETATPSPETTATPAPTRTPAPTPTLAPTAPLRSIRFLHMGIDGQSATTPTPRKLTFASEGPGQVTATLFQTTAGDVKFCLYSGNEPSAHECRTSSRTTLTGSTTAAGNTRWHVSLIGVDQGTSPSADVKLEFRSNSPRVTADGFRFQGTTFSDYNGIAALFKAAAGDVHVNGSWAGAQRSWRAAVVNSDSGENAGSNTGTGNDLSLTATVSAGIFRLTIENTEAVADQEVFLQAVISWP
jgi:hypothetical protein